MDDQMCFTIAKIWVIDEIIKLKLKLDSNNDDDKQYNVMLTDIADKIHQMQCPASDDN